MMKEMLERCCISQLLQRPVIRLTKISRDATFLIEKKEGGGIGSGSCDLCGAAINPEDNHNNQVKYVVLSPSEQGQLDYLFRNEGSAVPVISILCPSCGDGVGSLLSLGRRARRMEEELRDKIQTLLNIIRWKEEQHGSTVIVGTRRDLELVAVVKDDPDLVVVGSLDQTQDINSNFAGDVGSLKGEIDDDIMNDYNYDDDDDLMQEDLLLLDTRKNDGDNKRVGDGGNELVVLGHHDHQDEEIGSGDSEMKGTHGSSSIPLREEELEGGNEAGIDQNGSHEFAEDNQDDDLDDLDLMELESEENAVSNQSEHSEPRERDQTENQSELDKGQGANFNSLSKKGPTFLCHCGKSFKNKYKRNEHCNRVHVEEKLWYRCSPCKKKIKRQDHFKRHLLSEGHRVAVLKKKYGLLEAHQDMDKEENEGSRDAPDHAESMPKVNLDSVTVEPSAIEDVGADDDDKLRRIRIVAESDGTMDIKTANEEINSSSNNKNDMEMGNAPSSSSPIPVVLKHRSRGTDITTDLINGSDKNTAEMATTVLPSTSPVPPKRKPQRRSKAAALQKLQDISSPEISAAEESGDENNDNVDYALDSDSDTDRSTTAEGQHVVSGSENLSDEGPFLCTCGKSFDKLDLRNRHYGNVHLKRYRCDPCGLRFKDQYSLKRHVNSKGHRHRDNAKGKTQELLIGKDETIMRKKRKLNNTMKPVKPNKPPPQKRRKAPAEPIYELTDEDKAILSTDGPPFFCICEKVFDDKPSRDFHYEVKHGGKREWKCEPCDKILASEAAFKYHMTSMKHKLGIEKKDKTQHTAEGHPDKQLFVCEVCGKIMRSSYGYQYHIRFVHATNELEAKEVCKLCGKKYKSKSSLAWHIRAHRPKHVCDRCGKRFATASRLRLHATHVHEPQTVPRRKCPHCDKTFKVAQSFKEHLERIHGTLGEDGRLTCLICGEKFPTIKERKLHERRVHQGLPDCKCEQCGNVFENKTMLACHLLRHSEKKYECPKCSKKFGHTSTLKKHLATVCGDEDNEEEREAIRKAKRESMAKFRAKKKYKCQECGETFSQKPQLITHGKREHDGGASTSTAT